MNRETKEIEMAKGQTHGLVQVTNCMPTTFENGPKGRRGAILPTKGRCTTTVLHVQDPATGLVFPTFRSTFPPKSKRKRRNPHVEISIRTQKLKFLLGYPYDVTLIDPSRLIFVGAYIHYAIHTFHIIIQTDLETSGQISSSSGPLLSKGNFVRAAPPS